MGFVNSGEAVGLIPTTQQIEQLKSLCSFQRGIYNAAFRTYENATPLPKAFQVVRELASTDEFAESLRNDLYRSIAGHAAYDCYRAHERLSTPVENCTHIAARKLDTA